MMTMPLLGFILVPIVSGLMMYIRPHNWVKKVTVLIQILLLFLVLIAYKNYIQYLKS